MLAGSADFPITTGEVATAVQHDPVLVEDTMGSGDAASVEQRLAAIARKLPFPAYVALVSTPHDDTGVDPSADLATALRLRIATPGLYVVAAGGPIEVQVTAAGVDPATFAHRLQANLTTVAARARTTPNELPPAVGAEVALLTAESTESAASGSAKLSTSEITDLASRAHGPSTAASTDEPLTDNTGLRWMLGLLVGLLALLLVQRTLRGWPGWRGPTLYLSATDIDGLRRAASAEVLDLAERLPQAPAGPRADAAMLAREAAEPLLTSAEPAELIGALVLARTGAHALAVPTGVYHCCYLHPLHGAAITKVAWRLGDGSVSVPVCDTCSKRLARRRVPAVLTFVRDGAPVGYYERDDVWARTGYGSLVDDLARRVTLARGRDRSAR